MNQIQNPRKQSTKKFSKKPGDSERSTSQKPYPYNKDTKPFDSRERRNESQEYDSRNNDYKKAKGPQTNGIAIPKISEKILGLIKELQASNEGFLLDENENVLSKVPNTEIYKAIDEKCKTIIFDGVIAQRIVDRAIEMKVQRIIAVNIKPTIKIPDKATIELYKFTDFIKE